MPNLQLSLHLLQHTNPLQLLRNPLIRLSYGMTAAVMMAGFLVIPNISAFTQFNMRWPRDRLESLFLLGGVATFTTMRLTGWLVDRFGSLRVASGRIVVQVEDQGKGIAEDVMAQIGEPFFTTKAESGGTGLGLSISSSIVERHGGVLRFESNSDLGTTVSIDLPVSKEE